MKKGCVYLALLCASISLVACDSKEEKSPAKAVATAPVFPSDAYSEKNKAADANTAMVDEASMPVAAKRNNCTACHSIGKKIVGPAWIDVSNRYKGASKFEYNDKEYPLLEGLMMKVSRGGSGHWGSMPMPPNDYSGIKQADIKELVQFILGLAK